MGPGNEPPRGWSAPYRRAGKRILGHGKKHLLLAASILAYIVILPYFQGGGAGPAVFSVLISVVLTTIVGTVAGRRRFFMAAAVMLALGLLAQWLYLFHQTPDVFIAARSLWIGLIAIVMFALLRDIVMAEPPVPREILWSAVSLYLLIGLTWAIIFSMAEAVVPGSFVYVTDPGHSLGDLDLIYYSFVTLGTLGYGDIVPITAQARSMAIIEMICGVLFVAILISLFINKVNR
jgi:hypothetical protein